MHLRRELEVASQPGQAVRATKGEVVGANAWDGYAATAVCEAGMASLASGESVSVALVDRDSLS